ncbi:hypothetical protein Tco_0664529 [Tanacetum coccineum]
MRQLILTLPRKFWYFARFVAVIVAAIVVIVAAVVSATVVIVAAVVVESLVNVAKANQLVTGSDSLSLKTEEYTCLTRQK